MPRILVTGFGPFGRVIDNPSGRLAAALADATVDALVLPTSFGRAPALLRERLDDRYDTVLLLGVAESNRHFAVEVFGHNFSAARLPCVDGEAPHGVISPGVPERLAVTLPPEDTLAALSGRIEARRSESAGSYVCNALLFHALLEARAPRIGFVHVPPDEHTLATPAAHAVPFDAQHEALAHLVQRLSGLAPAP